MITTLEQSKHLKEIGAPQNTEFYYCETVEGATEDYYLVWQEYSVVIHPDPSDYAAYTLSELIEWLGDDFYDLLREKDETYTAHMNGDRGEGKIPLEAVYNLAIAIKEEE